jgi:hypothetical protein
MTSSNIRSLSSIIENKYFRNILIFLILILLAYNLLNIESFTSNPYQYAQNVIDEFTVEKAVEDTKNETLFRIDNIIAKSASNSKKENFANANANASKLTLTLYYKKSCPYCRSFMEPSETSMWTHIKTKSGKYANINEIDCDANPELCNKVAGLRNVPTLFLENLTTGNKEIIKGPRTPENVLKHIHIELDRMPSSTSSDTTSSSNETFVNTHTTTKRALTAVEKTCPPISFNKKADIENEKFYYQIFSDKGQYGYAAGGKDEPLSPFGAAYETVDAYLSSLPDPSANNMKLCANVYKDAIADFGLCNRGELNKILKYKEGKPQIDGTDYSTNTKVVNAINSACKL